MKMILTLLTHDNNSHDMKNHRIMKNTLKLVNQSKEA